MATPGNYAMVHIEKQFVANLIFWDGTNQEQQPPAGYEMILADGKFCGVGFLVENGEFIPVPPMDLGTNYQPQAEPKT